MKYKIVENKGFLSKPCEPVASVEEGEKIAADLLETISDNTVALGLSANQIGVKKKVSVVFVKDEPIVLINPRLISASSEKIAYTESCLSLPRKRIPVIRHVQVEVACDNWKEPRVFKADNGSNLTRDNAATDKGLLECVCVQHELDHLEGKLITDSDVRFIHRPIKKEKIGRNDRVMIRKGTETQYIKNKNLQTFVAEGWEQI